MTPRERAPVAPEGGEVATLLEERTRLQDWLAKLESAGAGANPRVVERVRNDYSDRLGTTLARLSEHLDSLRGEREGVEQRVGAAEQAHEEAQEQLEEQRLRNAIGELEAEEWEEREPSLTEAVERTAAELESLREEMRRLDELLAQIQNGAARVAAAEESTPQAGAEVPLAPPEEALEGEGEAVAAADGDAGESEPAAASEESEPRPAEVLGDPLTDLDATGTLAVGESLEEAREELPESDELSFLEGVASSSDEESTAEEGTRPSDLDFLMELDRAISGSGEAEAVTDSDVPAAGPAQYEPDAARASAGGDENPEDFKPTPGAKCPECGYTNDPDAWYCGVCGVDLA
jgi:DNA repair exonuclease SbcCD ATPase subunit